jgi:hypothetical protein
MGVLNQTRDAGAAAVLPNAQGPIDHTGFFSNIGAGFKSAVAGPHSTRVGDAIYQKKYYDQIIQALQAEGEQGEDTLDMINNAKVKRAFRNPFVSSPWENLTNSAHNPLADLYGGGDRAEMQQIWTGIMRVRQRKPDFLKQFPDPGSIDALSTKERQKQIEAANAVTSRASTAGSIGGFIGGMGGSVASMDPENAVGGGFGTAAGKTIARTVVKRAVEGSVANAAAAIIGASGQMADAERLGEHMTAGDAVHQVLESAAIGGVFGTAHASAPHVVEGVKAVGSKATDVIATHAPVPVRDAIAAASLRAGTVKDRSLLTEYRRLHSPYAAVGDISTPEERSAAHVMERDVEIREASPLHPDANVQHQDRLSAVANDLGVDLSVKAVPSPAPIQTPTVRDQSAGAIAPRRPATYQEAVGRAEGTGKNPDSSADGHFQFTEGTWLEYAPRVTDTTGKSKAEILALRHDLPTAQKAEQLFRADNSKYLRDRGIEDSPGNLSLAHFLGKADAAKVLRADPATPIERVIDPKSFAANHKVLAGKSASEVVAWAHKRIGAAVDGPVARADAIDEDFDPSSPIPYTVEALRPDELAPSAATPSDEPWNPVSSQHLLVWEASDGTRTVIDGGKRVAHAQSRYPEDQSIHLPAVVLREADGVSQEMAQLVGKLKNVNLGTTSLEEAAGTLADIPEIADALKRPQFHREIAAIAQLPYEEFGNVINGAVDPAEAATRYTYSREISPELDKAQKAYIAKTNARISQTELQRLSWALQDGMTPEAAATHVKKFFDDYVNMDWEAERAAFAEELKARAAEGKGTANEAGVTTIARGDAASGRVSEPLGGAGRDLAAEAPDENIPRGSEPSLFEVAVAARDGAEKFSDPVSPEAKEQADILEHDLRQDAEAEALVAYHGTRAAFDRFALGHEGEGMSGAARNGFFFSSDFMDAACPPVRPSRDRLSSIRGRQHRFDQGSSGQRRR